MSLINQMLRDLEQRQGPQSSQPAASIHAAPEQPPRRHWPWLLPAMLAALYYGWNEYQHQPSPTPPSAPIDSVQAPAPSQPIETSPQPIAAPTTSPLPIAIPQPTSTPLPTPKPTAVPTAKPGVSPALNQPTTTRPGRRSQPPSSQNRQVQALLQQAQNSSSLLMRKETLKEALQLDPENLAIREQLLEVLIKSGNGNELNRFLNDSLQRFPNQPSFITSLAQLQIQRKEFAAASGTLERIRSNEPGYLTLLAGSYQQQKRYRDAAEIYQRLTAGQPDKAEHWLGLGICSDNLSQKSAAIEAYQQALAKNTLNAEVVDYINQRLSALR